MGHCELLPGLVCVADDSAACGSEAIAEHREGALRVGKAKRNRRAGKEKRRSRVEVDSLPTEGERALYRLVSGSGPRNRLTLAGAYAWGYIDLALALREGRAPDWYDLTDPLDLILLGLAAPRRFEGPGQFGNVRTAWLRELRSTPHWPDVERFVREAVELSEETGSPVDSGENLMRLCARLEAAGLDRRSFSPSLHPEVMFADAPFATGVIRATVLPNPNSSVKRQANKFFDTLDTAETAEPSTCLDLLRQGARLMDRLGFPVRTESAMLIVALYIAIVASNDEPPDCLYDRAINWVFGLPEHSSLALVTDTLLAACEDERDPVDVVSCLLMVPAFRRPVDWGATRWHSAPGTDFAPLAIELGYRRIEMRDGAVVAIDPSTAAAFRDFERRFEDEYGSGPDPDSRVYVQLGGHVVPTPVLLELADLFDMHPAWRYACLREQAQLPDLDGEFATEGEREKWDAAVNRYLRSNPGPPPRADRELAKLRQVFVSVVLLQACHDQEFASLVVDALETGRECAIDVDMLEAVLEELATEFLEYLKSEPNVQRAVVERSRRCGGKQLVKRVKRASTSPAEYMDDSAVLFMCAVEYFSARMPERAVSTLT